MVIGQGPKSIDNSVNHVNGAMWLLETRESDDSSRTLSPAMFYSWRTAMVNTTLAPGFTSVLHADAVPDYLLLGPVHSYAHKIAGSFHANRRSHSVSH